ncbi:RNA-directed DNA polymerase, eukaryota [Tanacetum coccineum]
MCVRNSLHELEKIESLEIAQKVKIKWSIEGDEYSKYFHGILNKKRNQLAICGILVDEVWTESPIMVKNEFLSYFKNFFDRPCSSRRYWGILENDVVDAVSYFFNYGTFPRGSNSSFIALLVKEFRPISLIGSFYKIIAKILANRLVVVLRDIVNEAQSAFIANRQILDGPFIMNELIHWCKSMKKQTMIFKVDFEKAYDSVRWDYLDDVLKNFGFGSKWRGWIQNCLHSSRGSILVNGSPTSEFQFHKGLKQGDSLSPFLFILIMESLHLSFQKLVNEDLFKGISIGSSLKLSHLFYADDVIFMGQWSDSNISTIVHALKCFHRASGLRIYMHKSKLLGVAVDDEKVQRAANKLGCSSLKSPFSYLGIKIYNLMSRIKS